MSMTLLNGPSIAAGASTSSAIDCSVYPQGIKRITMPAAWTSAWLSFQISNDGTVFSDLYWPDGKLVVVTVVPGSTIVTNSSLWMAGWFKFRSGTRTSPIVQAAVRDFKCIVESTV